MYGHESQPGRVYACGAKPPEDMEQARAILSAGWRYRNDLVAAELDRRRASADALRGHAPAIARTQDQLDSLTEAILEARDEVRRLNAAAGRKRSPAAVGAGRRVQALNAERRTILGTHEKESDDCLCFRCRRKAAWLDPGLRAALAVIDADNLTRRKFLRRDSGLHWGSYLVIEQSLGGIRSGRPPRMVRHSQWDGAIAVQIQHGATWDEMLEGHGQARIIPEPLPDGAKSGGRRSRRPYYCLLLRVGTDGRTPRWLRVRFVLHRRWPEEARVKWIRLNRRRRGTASEWSVQFVLAREAWRHTDTATASGEAGVDLGWRLLPTGDLRVAMVSDGTELVLPEALIGRLRKCDDLRSIRARHFDRIRPVIARWLRDALRPEWMDEAGAGSLGQWRSPARLAAFIGRWAAGRIDGDDEVFAQAAAWRQKDRHLADWEGHQRAAVSRQRREMYRRFAARLRWQYSTLGVEDTDWRQLARTPAAEDDDEVINRRWYARLAAPGLLREILRHGHPDVRDVPAENTTRTCASCGADPAAGWDAVSEITYRCQHGHQLDQDLNAAINIRARGEAVNA